MLNIFCLVVSFFQVYVEFDDLEWEKREWIKVYEDFATFLVEYQLVWAKRKDPSQTQGSKIKQIQWPALVRHLNSSIYQAVLTCITQNATKKLSYFTSVTLKLVVDFPTHPKLFLVLRLIKPMLKGVIFDVSHSTYFYMFLTMIKLDSSFK